MGDLGLDFLKGLEDVLSKSAYILNFGLNNGIFHEGVVRINNVF